MNRTSSVALAVGAVGVAVALGTLRRKDVTTARAHTSRVVTVRGSTLDELYAWFKDDAKLASFLHGISDVRSAEGKQFWTANVLGKSVEAELEIVEDQPPHRREWRSSPDGSHEHQLTLTLAPAPADRGTEVRLSLSVTGPGSNLAAKAARLFGASPEQFTRESLRRFKSLVETGEISKAVAS